jgi:hypothetical protein
MPGGQAAARPQSKPRCGAEESGRRLARAVLESIDAIKLAAVVYPHATTRLTDPRRQFAARQVGRKTTKP